MISVQSISDAVQWYYFRRNKQGHKPDKTTKPHGESFQEIFQKALDKRAGI